MEVVVREVVETDLPVFFEHQIDPAAADMAAFASRERDAFMAHWARSLANESGVLRTVVADGVVAGNVVSWKDGDERLVGYWIGREHWGKGIATAALTEFLSVVRERPLHARVAPHNLGSVRVLEKCGFVRAGETDEELLFRLSS